MLDVGNLAVWAGWLVTIIGAVSVIASPILKAFKEVNASLANTSRTILEIKLEMENSRRDSQFFYDRLEKHEERLGHHKDCITQHNEQLKILMEERRG